MATRPPVESFMAPRAINQAYHLKKDSAEIQIYRISTVLHMCNMYERHKKGVKYVKLLVINSF